MATLENVFVRESIGRFTPTGFQLRAQTSDSHPAECGCNGCKIVGGTPSGRGRFLVRNDEPTSDDAGSCDAAERRAALARKPVSIADLNRASREFYSRR